MLAVIDGNWFAYRCHFRLAGLRGTRNAPIGACFGFCELFKELRENSAITHWCLVFDHPDPSFRHDLDPQYKAQRPPMPDDLRQQWPWLHDLAAAHGIPVMRIAGVEGDDTLAGFAAYGKQHEIPVQLWCIDKDLDQVLCTGVELWHPQKRARRRAEDVYEEFGLYPDQIVDLLALTGDTADNIPGAPGIGTKTAAKLLQKYQSLPQLCAHRDELTAHKRAAIEHLLPRLELNQQLVRLQPPPLSAYPSLVSLEKTPAPPNREAFEAQHRRLGLVPQRFFAWDAAHAAPAPVLLCVEHQQLCQRRAHDTATHPAHSLPADQRFFTADNHALQAAKAAGLTQSQWAGPAQLMAHQPDMRADPAVNSPSTSSPSTHSPSTSSPSTHSPSTSLLWPWLGAAAAEPWLLDRDLLAGQLAKWREIAHTAADAARALRVPIDAPSPQRWQWLSEHEPSDLSIRERQRCAWHGSSRDMALSSF